MGNSLFKNATNPGVGNAWQTVYTAPAGQASLLLQLNGAVFGAANLIASARIYDSSQNAYCYLIKNAAIPTGDAIRLIDRAKVVLEENDRFEVICDSPGETLDFVSSVIEDINDSLGGFSLGQYKNAIVPGIGNTWTTLYAAPAAKYSYVLQINAANLDETGIQISARLWDDSASQYCTLLDGGQLPIADAIRLIDDSKIVLEPLDRIEVMCTKPGQTADFVGSLIEDVNQI